LEVLAPKSASFGRGTFADRERNTHANCCGDAASARAMTLAAICSIDAALCNVVGDVGGHRGDAATSPYYNSITETVFHPFQVPPLQGFGLILGYDSSHPHHLRNPAVKPSNSR
jgi:hypothetical protein